MLTYFYFLTVAVIFAPVKCALEASDKKSRLLILHTSLKGYSSTVGSTLKADMSNTIVGDIDFLGVFPLAIDIDW